MNKTQAIRAVIDAAGETPTIFTTGFACRIANHVLDRPSHFYMTGSMGLAASIGVGVAVTTGRTTLVVDGDGSLLMNPVTLVTAGSLPDLPLVHVVLDDGVYASTGAQPVPSRRVDLRALAEAAGYPRVLTTDALDGLRVALKEELGTCSCPTFIHCRLDPHDEAVPPRLERDLREIAQRFTSEQLARQAA